MPPYALPAEQTKSTIKSNSSKGGGGFNELRFEDKKGSEEVYVHAEKDHLRVVKNDDTHQIGKVCVMEAGTSIELKVGSSSILIEPAKITIKSTQIAIEGSGAVDIKSGAVLTVQGALVKIN